MVLQWSLFIYLVNIIYTMKTFKKLRYFLLVFVFSYTSFNVNAQDKANRLVNQTIIDPTLNTEILYGYCTAEGLASSLVFSKYYGESLMNCSVDTFITSQIANIENISIKIVFGSWCPDSHREVPKFLRIMETMNISDDNITIIAVNRDKEFSKVDIVRMGVKLVPTFIVYREGNEVGRIIEIADPSLEMELMEMLK